MNTNKSGRPLRGAAVKLRRFLLRGAADQSGAAAVFFAVCLVLLAPLTLGLVDVYMATTQRGELLDALDTATLYVARSKETDAAKLNALGEKILKANLNLPAGQEVKVATFTLVDNRKIVSNAEITPPSFSPKFWTQNNLKAQSEVTRNSVNLEVAIVLDTTGSMSDEMASLRTAAKDLVDLVVQDVQTPYYSKASVVPYAVGVNAGADDDIAHGAPRGATNISGATAARPVKITSTAHGLANNEAVYITNVVGMTQLNNKEYVVKNRTNDTFELYNADGTRVDGRSYNAYTRNGSAQCRGYGCPSQRITTADGVSRLFAMSDCVTERVGGEQYTDAAPSTRTVGFHYQATTNIGSNTTCKSKSIVPLTSTKKTLTDKIDTLTSDGSTAGHIGLAWGWYTVSPAWNQVFKGSSAPASYTALDTVKVVVLMTDGAFNTNYYNGVTSKDSFGGTDDRINVNATNGNAYSQAASLCANMRAKGIVMYTVGFNLGNDTNTKNLMANCASKPENVFLPSSGVALKDAFKAIGQDINRLRISK